MYLTSHTRHILGKLKSTSVLTFGVLAVEVVFGGSHKRGCFENVMDKPDEKLARLGLLLYPFPGALSCDAAAATAVRLAVLGFITTTQRMAL